MKVLKGRIIAQSNVWELTFLMVSLASIIIFSLLNIDYVDIYVYQGIEVIFLITSIQIYTIVRLIFASPKNKRNYLYIIFFTFMISVFPQLKYKYFYGSTDSWLFYVLADPRNKDSPNLYANQNFGAVAILRLLSFGIDLAFLIRFIPPLLFSMQVLGVGFLAVTVPRDFFAENESNEVLKVGLLTSLLFSVIGIPLGLRGITFAASSFIFPLIPPFLAANWIFYKKLEKEGINSLVGNSSILSISIMTIIVIISYFFHFLTFVILLVMLFLPLLFILRNHIMLSSTLFLFVTISIILLFEGNNCRRIICRN